MSRRIRITAGEVSLEAALSGGPTAEGLWEKLPLTGRASTWGEEIYFSIPLSADPEAGAREVMEVGEIAYWPPGSAFCIFFGPTPASEATEPRAASPVNPLGKIEGDAKRFLEVKSGAQVLIEKAE